MSAIYPDRGPLPAPAVIADNLRKTIAVADRTALEGKHPFGAVLVGPDGEVVMEQGNISTVDHAELTIARRAYAMYKPEELWKMTLYTNFEPCCMCTAATYWANIGRIVYGAPETALLALTGDHPENPTMSQSCRETLTKGTKDIEVIGPVLDLVEEVVQSHRTFWKER